MEWQGSWWAHKISTSLWCERSTDRLGVCLDAAKMMHLVNLVQHFGMGPYSIILRNSALSEVGQNRIQGYQYGRHFAPTKMKIK